MTLHSTPSVHDTADAFFAPVSEHLHAVMRKDSPDQDRVTTVSDRLRAAIEGYMNAVDREAQAGR